MISPPRTGTRVQFHHPTIGWTQGIVRKVVHAAEDLEDVPHWGCWVHHPYLGKTWVLGGEVCEDDTYAR